MYFFLDADYFGAHPEVGFPLTDRSVVQHQFDGEQGWIMNITLPHISLNKGT